MVRIVRLRLFQGGLNDSTDPVQKRGRGRGDTRVEAGTLERCCVRLPSHWPRRLWSRIQAWRHPGYDEDSWDGRGGRPPPPWKKWAELSAGFAWPGVERCCHLGGRRPDFVCVGLDCSVGLVECGLWQSGGVEGLGGGAGAVACRVIGCGQGDAVQTKRKSRGRRSGKDGAGCGQGRRADTWADSE